VVGRFVDRLGGESMMVFGTIAVAASMLVIALVHETSSVTLHIAPALMLNGLGFAMTTVSTKVVPLAAVGEDLMGRVTALVTVTAKLAAGFGVTFATGLFNLLVGPSTGRAVSLFGAPDTDQVRDFVRSHIGASDLPATLTASSVESAGFASVQEALETIDKAFALSFSLLAGIAGVLVLLGVLGMALLLRGARE
jgi:hypothetical protein